MDEGLYGPVDTSQVSLGLAPAYNTLEEYDAAVREALSRLDGTSRSAVQLLTGATYEEIDELGGFGEDV